MFHWTPQIDFGPERLTLRQPALPWTVERMDIGGFRISGADVPNTFIRRTRWRVDITLRVYESELTRMWQAIAYARRAPFWFYFWFSRHDFSTRYPMFLLSPQVGDEGLSLARDESDPSTVLFPVSLWTSNRQPITAYHSVR